MAEERLGFVGIVVEDRASVRAVNEILSGFAPIIRGRMGVPDPQGGEAVIGLIVRDQRAAGRAYRPAGQPAGRAGQERPHLCQSRAASTGKKGMIHL